MTKTTAPSKRGVGRPARDEQEFLDAALAVFSRNGLEGSSMEDLAVAARTTKPTLYARFGSKKELYERVVRLEADAFIDSVLDCYDEAAESPSIFEMCEGTVRLWFEYLNEHPEVLELLFSPDRSAPAEEVAEEVEERITAGLARLMEGAMGRANRHAPAQARFLAAMVFGATLHATRLNMRLGLLSIDHAVALATSFLYAGHRGVDLRQMERPALRQPPRLESRRRRGTR